MFNIAHVVTVNNTVKLVLTFDQTTFSSSKLFQICKNVETTRTKYQKQTKVNISKQKYRKTTTTIEMQLLVHNYKSYSTIRKHFCLCFTTCALSQKNQFSNFWQNNYAFQYFVCLIKGYLQKKSIKRKKRKKKLFTAQVEPGPPDCHDSTISTWPPQLSLMSCCILKVIMHHKCTTTLLAFLRSNSHKIRPLLKTFPPAIVLVSQKVYLPNFRPIQELSFFVRKFRENVWEKTTFTELQHKAV